MSNLGVDQSGDDVDAVVKFSFRKDGSGSMELDLPEGLPNPGSRSFRYSVEGDKLTVEYDGQQKTEFTFVLKGDTLKLDGRVSLELKRQK